MVKPRPVRHRPRFAPSIGCKRFNDDATPQGRAGGGRSRRQRPCAQRQHCTAARQISSLDSASTERDRLDMARECFHGAISPDSATTFLRTSAFHGPMSIEKLPNHSGANENSYFLATFRQALLRPARSNSSARERGPGKRAIVTNFLQLFLSAGGRPPAAILDRFFQAAAGLFKRRQRRRMGIERALPDYLQNNHLRGDIGLPPVDSHGRPI